MDDLTIYVIDDDDGVRDATRALLEGEGHRVVEFASAEDFLAETPPERAGCLVLDVYLRGMNGLELLRRLSDDRSKLRVIITTVRPGRDIERAAREIGAPVLEKPYPPHDLLAAVETALGAKGRPH
jgi:two-component system CheB/CheR fusion protein